MSTRSRVIMVSNRLPVTVDSSDGDIFLRPSSGGLVSALLPVCRNTGGCWVGWPGIGYDPEVAEVLRFEGCPDYSLDPVFLGAEEIEGYYDGFSNGVIWPLFHDFSPNTVCDPEYWTTYREVNRKFAAAVSRIADVNDLVWVHDYHLMLCAHSLRKCGVKSLLGYFHHIPFPSPDLLQKLPWRTDILNGLLRYDLIGFQTERDKANFVACVRRYIRGVRLRRAGDCMRIRVGEITTTVGAFPISIDSAGFEDAASSDEVLTRSAEIKAAFSGEQLILGVDRLDYTKGLCERLRGFEHLLEHNSDLRGKVRFVQVVVPSREEIDRYADLRSDLERLIAEVNGRYATPTWTPITYMHRSITHAELVALYRAADVMAVTPLKDGMNLVAKEFCAARTDEKGALVLSEMAGAAAELRVGALVVNPYDTGAVSRAMRSGLAMNAAEQQRRMHVMRRVIRDHDVFRWASRFEMALALLTQVHMVVPAEQHNATELRAAGAA